MSKTFNPYYKWLGISPDEQPPNLYRLLGVPRYQLRGTGQVLHFKFVLLHPQLANRQNNRSDFRIRGSKLIVHQVQVSTMP